MSTLRTHEGWTLDRDTYPGGKACWVIAYRGERASVWPSRRLALDEWAKVTTQDDEQVTRELIARAEHLQRMREAVDAASSALADTVREAHAQGVTLYRIEQVTGLARMTVRRWALGE